MTPKPSHPPIIFAYTSPWSKRNVYKACLQPNSTNAKDSPQKPIHVSVAVNPPNDEPPMLIDMIADV